MATINYSEVNEEELINATDDIEGEIINDEIDEVEAKKPSKVKKALKVTWCVAKKIMPIAVAYTLGYITKAVAGRVIGAKVTNTDIPEIPVKTEVIDVGDAISDAVVSEVVDL